MGFLSKKSAHSATASSWPEREIAGGRTGTSMSSPSPTLSNLSRKLSLKNPSQLSRVGTLRPVFDYFDENGDGRISPVELRSCVNALGGALSEEEAEVAVRASDEDGDGLLGYEEFERLVDGCDEEERDRGLREAFGMYEVEGKGYITAVSLRRMLNRLGQSRSIHECKVMIRAFDLNGDGVLTFDEFQVMMR
ncbi:hypothetical protein SAY87_021887 [Trapa incisa]|uniref:EF-hand domain-containing protein n=1 Tax=Trapa incisa TaxID=236973 RepID=A0AAN7JU00_9MYRT|nr:hypothetical protein SAY87_021887 [Trapa incisa]